MVFLYSLLLSLTLPIWLPIVWLRARKRPVQPIWEEKWGNFPFGFEKGNRRIWIHAVSVGEVLAVGPILREVRKMLPKHEIVLSVTTSTGHGTAQSENERSPGLYDKLVYFPFDLARPMLAAMQRVQPDVVAVMETELWPCFFWAAKVVGAKTLLVNGRISDRSFPRARFFKFFYSAALKNLDRCLMQTEVDSDRIAILGAKTAEVFGNCKFDQAVAEATIKPAEIRREFGIPPDALLLVIGSTRGVEEEALVLEAIPKLKAWQDRSLYVIHAPRHIEKIEELESAVATRLNVTPGLRSKKRSGRYTLLDTYGELNGVYGAADVVVIGGGFANLGGQNLIQPLAQGKPVVHGPHMQNFRSAAESAEAAGATIVAATADVLADAVGKLLDDKELRAKMGKAAAELVRENVGASRRYAQAIADAAQGG